MLKKILKATLILIFILTTVFLYSMFIGTKGLKVKEYKITNKSLPDGFNGFKIIHLTDIHFGRIFNEPELIKMIDQINMIKPDIVFITGDLLDRNTELSKEQKITLIKHLKNINVTVNKYAIKGNHDYQHSDWESIINDSNFINLNDNYDLIYNNDNNPILINGISSNLENKIAIKDKLEPINKFIRDATTPTEDDVIKVTVPEFKILIMHEPDFINKFNYEDYNLILAGHSHNGQVRIPFIGATILPPGAKKYYDNYYKLNNVDLYISSGLGTSTLDVRLFNKPSFNFYRLTNK